MSESELTVRDVLSAPGPNDRPGAPDRWTIMKERFRSEVKGIQWTATMPDMAEMLAELFDIPIPGLMLGAWRKADALDKLLKESEQSPHEVMYLELADHTIERNLEPYIEIRIEGFPPRRLYFKLNLNLRINGFVLKVRTGKILEIQTAQCYVQGNITFNNIELLKKEFEPITLPGRIPIADDGRENYDRTIAASQREL